SSELLLDRRCEAASIDEPPLPVHLGRMGRAFLVLVVLALSLPATTVARPEIDDPDTEVAKRQFKKGSALYMEGKYEEALVAFESAKLAKPLPAFDYNIALCFDRL